MPEESIFYCRFVKAEVYSLLSDEENEQMRMLGKLDENEYGFYMTGYLIPAHAEKLLWIFGGDGLTPAEAGIGVPQGTCSMFYRCKLVRTDGGWRGVVIGNGSW